MIFPTRKKVKNLIEKYNAKTVVDLGAAECKFVHELCTMGLRRVIGVDFDYTVLKQGERTLADANKFDECFNGGHCREEDLAVGRFQFRFLPHVISIIVVINKWPV